MFHSSYCCISSGRLVSKNNATTKIFKCTVQPLCSWVREGGKCNGNHFLKNLIIMGRWHLQSIELVMGNSLDALFRHKRSTFLVCCSDQFLVLLKKDTLTKREEEEKRRKKRKRKRERWTTYNWSASTVNWAGI